VAKLRALVEQDLPAVINVVRKAALSGDMEAARMLLARCVPLVRPVDAGEPFELVVGAAAEQADAVAQAVAAGRMAPERAGAVLAALRCAAELREHGELIARLDALEAAAARGREST
jgi:hypothetical protein